MDANHVSNIASHIGLNVPYGWTGVDAVWPLLERMRREGAVVLVKLDGERTGPDDAGPYTVLASRGPLGEDGIRTDSATVEEGLIYVISRYASRAWGVPLPV